MGSHDSKPPQSSTANPPVAGKERQQIQNQPKGIRNNKKGRRKECKTQHKRHPDTSPVLLCGAGCPRRWGNDAGVASKIESHSMRAPQATGYQSPCHTAAGINTTVATSPAPHQHSSPRPFPGGADSSSGLSRPLRHAPTSASSGPSRRACTMLDFTSRPGSLDVGSVCTTHCPQAPPEGGSKGVGQGCPGRPGGTSHSPPLGLKGLLYSLKPNLRWTGGQGGGG